MLSSKGASGPFLVSMNTQDRINLIIDRVIAGVIVTLFYTLLQRIIH